MGVILTTEVSHLFMDQAMLLPEDRALANHWASGFINSNPAYRWIIGKYVESERANHNNMRWRAEDLPEARATIDHAPMNILHRPHYIVGSFVGSEMMYPSAMSLAQETNEQPPYIEAVGAFWSYYFPNELAVVAQAYDEGSLFFSMECLSETITWSTPSGDSKEFDYAGPRDASYAGWDDRDNISTLNKPLFVGGALILPPEVPAWRGASIESLGKTISDNSEEAESVYDMFKEKAPHLGTEVWEELMLSVMAQAKISH